MSIGWVARWRRGSIDKCVDTHDFRPGDMMLTGRKCAALVTARLASHVMSPCRAVLVLSVSSPAFGGRAGVGGWGGVAGVVGLLCRLRIATGEYLPPLRVEDDGGGHRKLQGEAEEVGRRPGEGVRESGEVEGPA